MTKKEITAAELLARLQHDPAHARSLAMRQEEQNQRRQEVLAALDPIVRELRDVGMVVDSIDDLPLRKAPLDEKATTVLRQWVRRLESDHAREQVVRALAAAQPGFPGAELAEAFDQTASESLRWAIANTVASACPTGISEWVRERVQEPASGKAREMLVLAAARLLPRGEANDLLRSLAATFTGHVAIALAEIGGVPEMALLDELRNRTSGWEAREVDKAKRSIKRRLGV